MDFAQKYRAMSFAEVQGQENQDVIRLIKSRLKYQRLHDFIVYYGEPGTCKTVMSLLTVKAAHCEHPTEDGEPCNSCPSCKMINETLYVNNRSERGTNIYVFSMAEEETQDDNIRSILTLLKSPNRMNKPRFIIINELHNCSFKKQQNFLVPFEAIPQGTHVIVTTSDYQTKIADGLKSRAKAFQMTKPSIEEIAKRLQTVCDLEGFKVKKDDLRKLIRIKDCNMRECLNSLEDIFLDADAAWSILLKQYTQELENLIDYIKAAKSNVMGLIPYVNNMENAVDFVHILPDALYKAISLKDATDHIVTPDLRRRVNEQMDGISLHKLKDINNSLTGLHHITESEAKRILFMVGCDINEEIFKQVSVSDIDNSLDKVGTTNFKNSNAKVYSIAECTKDDSQENSQNSDESSTQKVSAECVMEFIQNEVGEVDLSDITGEG